MTRLVMLFTCFGIFGIADPVAAQNADLALTYHIERTSAAQLTIENCGMLVEQAAEAAGLRHDQQAFPGQLVTVSGGAEGAGVFVVQCITVGDTTVTVVQGIDYQQQKGALGDFADKAFAAMTAAIK